jgi:hypothetical protein
MPGSPATGYTQLCRMVRKAFCTTEQQERAAWDLATLGQDKTETLSAYLLRIENLLFVLGMETNNVADLRWYRNCVLLGMTHYTAGVTHRHIIGLEFHATMDKLREIATDASLWPTPPDTIALRPARIAELTERNRSPPSQGMRHPSTHRKGPQPDRAQKTMSQAIPQHRASRRYCETCGHCHPTANCRRLARFAGPGLSPEMAAAYNATQRRARPYTPPSKPYPQPGTHHPATNGTRQLPKPTKPPQDVNVVEGDKEKQGTQPTKKFPS